jgi:DNA repair protein RadC
VLSDAELLAIILKTGNKNENAIDMSNRLISKYGFSKLSNCSHKELQEINGIGMAKACQICALFELNKRHAQSKMSGKTIKNAKDVYDYLCAKMCDLKQEHFVVLHLDSKNKIIKEETVFVGGLNSALIHPREIFKSAIKESSNSIILAHNHPSGDCEPSEEDKDITEKMNKTGEIVGIKVLDHVIVGKNRYWSFDDHNLNV